MSEDKDAILLSRTDFTKRFGENTNDKLIVPEPNWEIYKTPGGSQFNIFFKSENNLKFVKEPRKVKEKTKELLFLAYDYLRDQLGEDSKVINDKWFITFSHHGRFTGMGQVMHVPVLEIERYLETEGKDALFTDFIHSDFVHEILHSVDEEESLTIFGELTFMAQKGHYNWIDKFKKLYNDKNSEDWIHYRKGLEKVSGFFKYNSVDELLDGMKKMPNDKLTINFRNYFKEYSSNFK